MINFSWNAKGSASKKTTKPCPRFVGDEEETEDNKREKNEKSELVLVERSEAVLVSTSSLRDEATALFEEGRTQEALTKWQRVVDVLARTRTDIISQEDEEIVQRAIREEQKTVADQDPPLPPSALSLKLQDLKKKIEEKLSITYDMMSQAEIAQENDWRAIQLAEKALHTRPDWVDGLLTLSRAQRNYGDIIESVKTLKRALDQLHHIDPQDPQRLLVEEELQQVSDLETRFLVASEQTHQDEVQVLREFQSDCDRETSSLTLPKLPVAILRARVLDS